MDGAVPTDANNTSYKFPCKATLPDVYLGFQNGEAFGFRGQALTFNNPDPDDSKLACTCLMRDSCTAIIPLLSTPNIFNPEYRLTFEFEVCTGPLSSVGVAEQAVGGVGAMFFESTYVVFNMSAEPSISFSVWNATAEDYGL